ncbi:hypothetical protein EGN72_03235 [Pseudorhodobacter sp. E13]|nr:hypothetical protein EGN72_03235 [Pseudorhodobacter sp. E13]
MVTEEVGNAVDTVTEDPGYFEFTSEWQGIGLHIRYNACWLGRCAGLRTHHVELRSEGKVKLPVTATGYRSLFLHGEDPFADWGGDVVAFVSDWLDDASRSADWQRYVEESRQLSLF